MRLPRSRLPERPPDSVQGRCEVRGHPPMLHGRRGGRPGNSAGSRRGDPSRPGRRSPRTSTARTGELPGPDRQPTGRRCTGARTHQTGRRRTPRRDEPWQSENPRAPRRVGVERWPWSVALRPPVGGPVFVRLGFHHDPIGAVGNAAWMPRCRSAGEATGRQIEAAPEEMDRAGLTHEAGLEALQHSVDTSTACRSCSSSDSKTRSSRSSNARSKR